MLGIAGVVVAKHLLRSPESTAALRGKAIATELGCFGCHGYDGRGGILDPGARSGSVPGWDGPTVSTFARDEQEVREWILDGAPRRVETDAITGGRAPLVRMPAYRGKITEQELADLLAYFRAGSAFGVDMPEPAYEGWKVAGHLGCFGCHGPSGIGGCPNPGSFKGRIPSWDGAEFLELVRDDGELREWVLEGHARRLWDNPVARHFLERQTIEMPAYRQYVSDDEVIKISAYIRWLRKK